MILTKYKHKEFTLRPNKKMIPINYFTFAQVNEFNKVYQYAKRNFELVKPTKSQGISNVTKERFTERYFVVKGNERFELVIVCADGCYRFVIKNPVKPENTVSGTQSCREIYKQAEKYGIDFNAYSVEDGTEEKKMIQKPHIEVLDTFFLGKELSGNVHHIDLNSSYASRLCEEFPELTPIYEELYAKRKLDNNYFKHVMTNSIGCWQSEFCVDSKDHRTTKPYQFAKLSRVAVNGTRKKIEEFLVKLIAAKKRPLLTNTDGIWYYGNKYHDSDEGFDLCQWKHDHSNCKFLMVSVGAYQYEENGVCHTVVRGICNLDAIEPDRTKWKFGDIKKIKNIVSYKFDEEIGVVKNEEVF